MLSVIILTSCQEVSSPKELMDRFYTNKKDFNLLVTKLQTDNRFDSLFQIEPYTGLPDIEQKYPGEFARLKKIGITAASSHANTCKQCSRWYLFKTNWPGKHPVFFIYHDDNDSTESFKDFYKKDNYGNETWGLGDDWKMFRFVDTIRNIKY